MQNHFRHAICRKSNTETFAAITPLFARWTANEAHDGWHATVSTTRVLQHLGLSSPAISNQPPSNRCICVSERERERISISRGYKCIRECMRVEWVGMFYFVLHLS